mgnify:CR=1 FL=1
MKKLLGIVVLGLLLSGNVNALQVIPVDDYLIAWVKNNSNIEKEINKSNVNKSIKRNLKCSKGFKYEKYNPPNDFTSTIMESTFGADKYYPINAYKIYCVSSIAEKPKKQEPGNKKQVLEGIDKLSRNYDYHFFAHSTSGEQFWGSTINRSQYLQLGYAKSTKGYECSLKSFQANSQAPYKGTWNLECPNFKADGSWTQESLSSNGIGKGFSDNGNVVSAYFSKNRQAIWGIANKFFDGQGSDIKIVEKPKKEKPKPKLEDEKIVPAGSGSGFFVLKDGTIITNYHVIEGCEVNKVSYKGTQYNAKVLSVDKVNDIAILKTDIVPQRVFSVSDDDVSLLEDVVVAGYPLGKQISAAIKTHKGVVTALAGAGDNYSFFQTDAAINQGNSGGPIINQKGNVVGIAVATWVEEGVQGVHFGIKSSTLKTFASANGLSFISPNNREFSNKELGKLITEGTVYVECHMTLAKIKKMIAEMENKKAFFSEHKK